MLGAITGDIIGSIYEWNNIKTTEFPLFKEQSFFTDDSILTIAIADWLLQDDSRSTESLTTIVRYWGRRYPDAEYGSLFRCWLDSEDPKPYKSWGNGSAMRVSAVGWVCNSLEETLDIAKRSAAITHNHREGIWGAQATAACIYLARTGASKEEIKSYVIKTFGYNLTRTCDEIRLIYGFDGSCMGTVPEAIVAFLDSSDFESAVRLAISLGSDSDTLACITGGIAEAYYKEIPENIKEEVFRRLSDELAEIVDQFRLKYV